MFEQTTASRKYLLLLSLFLIPVAVYSWTITFGFSGFDDTSLIPANAPFLSNVGNIGQAFATDAFLDKSTPFYRPLQTVSYMLDIKLWQMISPAVFHLTNILLAGVITCLVFLVMTELLVPLYPAAVLSLIFCLHPLFASTVSWIPARGDLLLTLFALLALYALLGYLRTGSGAWLFLHFCAYVCALFSKETAAVLPVFFVACWALLENYREGRPKYPLCLTVYLVTGGIWFWIRSQAILGKESANALIGLKALALNLRAVPEALSSFFLPVAIAPIPAFTLWKTATGTLFLLGLILLASRYGNKRFNLLCIAWFFGLSLPAMLFKHIHIDYLNHRFFLPLAGIVLLLAGIVPKRLAATKQKQLSLGLLPLLLLLTGLTIWKSFAYRDPLTFYQTARIMNPGSAFVLNNLGIQRAGAKDPGGALEDFTRAIQLAPAYEEAYSNRGFTLLQSGDSAGAIADFDRAIALNSSYALPYYHRGTAYYNRHDYQRAVADFSTYTSMTTTHLDAFSFLGKAEAQLGHYSQAVAHFDRAINSNPDNYLSFLNRAIARFYLKDFAGTIADCDRALVLKPGEASVTGLRDKALAEVRLIHP